MDRDDAAQVGHGDRGRGVGLLVGVVVVELLALAVGELLGVGLVRGVVVGAESSSIAPTLLVMRILHTSDWHLGRTLHGVDLSGPRRNRDVDVGGAVPDQGGVVLVVIAGVPRQPADHEALFVRGIDGRLDGAVLHDRRFLDAADQPSY